jgi:hypothetical protein
LAGQLFNAMGAPIKKTLQSEKIAGFIYRVFLK